MRAFSLAALVRFVLFLFTVHGLTACIEINNELDEPTETQALENIKSVGYIYHAENGNRLVTGQGDLPNLLPIDITLPSSVTWLSASHIDQQSVWVAVLANGMVKAYKVTAGNAEEIAITPNQLSSVVPPTITIDENNNVKLANIFDDGSPYTSPVILDKQTGERVYIATNGDLVLKTGNQEQRLAINALPYARILLDENKRILVLSNPTSRYDHLAVLGSNFQHAASITLVETEPTFSIATEINIASPDVIEGNALIWKDVNTDGVNEIITTVSNTNGARIVVFNEDGSLYGESSAIELNHRWRHQLAIAPFKNATETSLVSVHIPHLEPAIEYIRLDDASMQITRQRENYTSHLITGINIDMGISGDFDNDGNLELVTVHDKEALSRIMINDSKLVEYGYS